MNDYERIATVIRYLVEHHVEQPHLHDLAQRLHLSPFHFHRLFVSWAGVSPKDFLQTLTLCHTKALLRKGESVLDAAMHAGLSGPGRLHDLFITLEGATPGEGKSQGTGVVVSYGFAESPFGRCLLAETPRGLCRLVFCDDTRDSAVSTLHRDWPCAALKRDDARAVESASRIFRHGASGPKLRMFLKGTSFQLAVWRALLLIPEGALVSYGKLAEVVGRPGAARAVGTAVGSNPIAFLIPCHRVIRENGLPGGYRWGLDRKRAIIAWECASKSSALGM